MSERSKAVICIVTPGTRDANNGNWRTASRWATMLRDSYQVILQSEWQGERADVLVALHARRSAPSVAAFRAAHPGKPIAVMLTGTDLYRDLPARAAAAIESLDAADRIVALQDEAPGQLRAAWRAKCEVIYQSAPALKTVRKPEYPLRAVVVGHLRPEKDPRTLFQAVRLLPAGLPIEIRHIGAPLDERLAVAARKLEAMEPRYCYSGALPHALARAAIRRAHVLVHPSVMEGGANVIVEAIMTGTPVLASRIPGNVGMLGAAYPGFFEVGDASDLAACLVQLCGDVALRNALVRAAHARQALFRPSVEARAVRRLVRSLLARGARVESSGSV